MREASYFRGELEQLASFAERLVLDSIPDGVLADLQRVQGLYAPVTAGRVAEVIDFFDTVRMVLADVLRTTDELRDNDDDADVLGAPDALLACKHCGGIVG